MNNNPKIFKASAVEAYFNSTTIKKNTELYCKELIRNAKLEAELIKKEAYKEALGQVHRDSKRLNLQLQQKNQQFVEKLESEIYSIINEVLLKLGVLDNFSKHISFMIKEELKKSNISKNEELTISANKIVLKNIQDELINSFNNIIFKVDDALLDNECICETNLYLMRININQLKAQLEEFAFIKKLKIVETNTELKVI